MKRQASLLITTIALIATVALSATYYLLPVSRLKGRIPHPSRSKRVG